MGLDVIVCVRVNLLLSCDERGSEFDQQYLAMGQQPSCQSDRDERGH
jgi:hypothetical protein